MEDARLNLENINKKFDRKNTLDKVIKGIFLFIALLCASFVIFITVFIVYKGIVPFVQKYSDGVGG